jgi:hypothetical protein
MEERFTLPKPEQKISTWARALAWLFLVCTAIAIASAASRVISGNAVWPSGGSGLLVFAALGGLLIVPLFISVAMRGRPPRWWSSFEDAVDLDTALRRYLDKRK